jgi:hypothetical protein
MNVFGFETQIIPYLYLLGQGVNAVSFPVGPRDFSLI